MARTFNGTSDRIDYNNIDSAIGQPQTFSALVYAENGGDEYLLVSHQSGNSNQSASFRLISNRRLMLGIYNTTTHQNRISDINAFPIQEWFHFFMTWDGQLNSTGIRIYVNNVEVSYSSTTNGVGTQVPPVGLWSLGGANWMDAVNFEGVLAEVGWWNRVLSAKERGMLADGSSPLFIRNGLKFAPDLIRHQRDSISGQAGTLDGTTISKHPFKVIYPSKPTHIFSRGVTIYTLGGLIEAQSGVATGNLQWLKELSGSIDAQSGVTGSIEEIIIFLSLSGLIEAQSGASAKLQETSSLSGSIAAQATVSAKLRDLSSLSGSIDAQSNVTGFLVEFVELDLGGTIDAQSGVTGNLIQVYIAIPPFMEKDFIDPYSSGAWLWLVAIDIPGQDIHRRAKNTEPIVYGGVNFPKGNVIIGKQKASSDGSIPQISLKIAQEPDGVLENIINASKGGRDGTVKIIRTCEKYLDTPVDYLESDFDILTAGSDYQWVVFTLGLPNLLTQRIPLWLYSSKVCPLATPSLFKGVRCQYVGADPTCTGLFEDCYTKGNQVHWGAEIGLEPNAVRL